MKIESVIPILYSDDVTRSISYYTEVLGFKESWSWDEGPSFGGVVDGDATIFFHRDSIDLDVHDLTNKRNFSLKGKVKN